MTRRELMRYEERLLELKRQLLRQRGYTGAMLLNSENGRSSESPTTPSDIGEQGYDTYQRELASRMTSEQTRTLIEIDEALVRIQRKTYGICEICGKPIPKARLDIVPYARYDVKCLRARDAARAETPVNAAPKVKLRRRKRRKK